MNPTFSPGKAANPVTQVEVTISCKNLRDRDLASKSDPICVVFIKEFGSDKFSEVGRTERISNSLNPEFAKKLQIDYRFEESQLLRFEVYDIDSDSKKLSQHDFLGRTEITLGEIIGSPGSKVHRKLTGMSGNLGSILIAAEELATCKEVAYIHFQAMKLDKKDFFGKSDPFLNIYRRNGDGSLTLAHRTDVVMNNLNPSWKQFKLNLQQLCGGDKERPIKIDCYDWDSDGGHDFIGGCEISVNKLVEANRTRSQIPLINDHKKHKKRDYKSSGQLVVATFNIVEEASFLDFIRGGTQLIFTVAVDFTASNGNPNTPQSLHYIHPHYPNQYMVALRAVGEICQDYNRDKMFVGLGFGAKIPPTGDVSHEFFLNGSPNDPRCRGIDGLMNAYRQSLMSIQLYGPTNFSPVINHVARIAAIHKDGSQYFILLIITDGVITDMDKTVAAIVNASFLPMSIIIVGVGNDSFEAMDYLDCDKGRLSYQGKYAERDIVQFVPFRNYMGTQQNQALSQARLAKDVLAEVPLQLTSYMYKRGIKARPPVPAPDPSTMPPIEGLSISGGPGGAPSYPGQGPAGQGQGQAPYPAGPSAPNGSVPYPPQGGSGPSRPGQAPYPGSGGGGAPYPPAGAGGGPSPYPPPSSQGQSPYPSAPGQYPPGGPTAGGGAPYPPGSAHAAGGGPPYPGARSGSPGRQSAGGGPAPYPPQQGGNPGASATPYPPAQGSTSSPYPNLSSSSPYPPTSGGTAAPYPPSSAGAPPYPGAPARGAAPYPPSGGGRSGGAPYPPAQPGGFGSAPYPPSVPGYPGGGSAPYPPAGGGSPYPPQR